MATPFDDAAFHSLESAFISGGRPAVESLLHGCEAAKDVADFIDALFSKRNAEAVDALLRAYGVLKALPEPMIGYGLYAAPQADRRADLAWPVFHCASKAVDEGRLALAMELVKKIYNDALSGHDAEFLVNGDRLLAVASLLERIAELDLGRVCAAPHGAPKVKPRVAMVTINMLESVSAYSKTALQFAKYVDRSRFDCYEYFTEETLTERRQHALFKSFQRRSEQNAPLALSTMRASGAVVKFVPAELDFHEGAIWLAEELERDAIDAVIFQGGVASPMMWLASRLAQVPSKLTLCVGVNMYQAGRSATVYMSNPANLEKERAFWRPEWGRQIFLPGGVDIEAATCAVPLLRADFSIPAEAATFGLLSNYPGARAGQAYMACVAKILKACPTSLFVCLGPDAMSSQKAFMEVEGLSERCRWLSWQHKDAFASLKLLDLYFNEFPLGGAQSVLEAMACGIPALAVRWSPNYAESAGAEIAGPDCAFGPDALDAYVAKAVELLSDSGARESVAKAQFERARGVYSAETFIRRLCELAISPASP
jgi:hypothetical protein